MLSEMTHENKIYNEKDKMHWTNPSASTGSQVFFDSLRPIIKKINEARKLPAAI